MGLVAWYPLVNASTTNQGASTNYYNLELSDGSRWLQICSHKTSEGNFSSSDDFSKFVYHSENVWANFSEIKTWDGTNYEFLYYEGTTARRWSQTIHPENAVYSDVGASSSNYTSISNTSGRGGLYKKSPTNTYFCINNGNSGNWYGAIGSWTSWNGGIPGFTAVTTDMKLYIRVKTIEHENLIKSATFSTIDGKIGKTPSFTGSNYMYTHEFIELKKEMSFCAWFMMTTVDSTIIMDLRNSSNLGYVLYYSGYYFQIYSTETAGHNENYTISANTWYHICVTIDEEKSYLYINGELLSSSTSGRGTDWSNVYSKITIGRLRNVSSGYLKGSIADFRVYDHKLSLKEIKEITKARIVHYDFNDPLIVDTTNLITGFGNMTRCTKIDDHSLSVDWVNNNGDTYFFLNTSEALSTSSTYTISCYCEGLGDTTVKYGISNLDSHLWTLKDGFNSYTFTPNDTIVSRFFIDDKTTRTAIQYTINNLQLEKRDYATPFVDGTREASYLQDSSGFGYNTTGFNNIELGTRSGHGEYTAIFNGSDSYIKVPVIKADLIKDDYTLNFWVKPYDNGTRDVYLGDHQISGTTSTYSIERNTGNFLRYYHNGNPDYNGTTATASNTTGVQILKDEWTMVTIVYTPGTIKFYKNGVMMKSYSHTATITKTGVYYIGRDNRTGTTAYNGEFGELSIYATCLSDDDILALYRSKAQITKNGVFMTYNLNEKEGNTVTMQKNGQTTSTEFIEYGETTRLTQLRHYTTTLSVRTGSVGMSDGTSTVYTATGEVTIPNIQNIAVSCSTSGTSVTYTYNESSGLLSITLSGPAANSLYTVNISYDSDSIYTPVKITNSNQLVAKNFFNEWT